ncbi:hypothetical protein POTOM_028867 [Populus tomentosa]|uniref:Chaperone DnaJ C-terminal domain-containing protein n=1 Tax=Populus tomentosa TaxID=118781 RepID=A0A8X7ZF62_POPTO|nr:hypothetical protein POTOM_028867 [Populus tomentosa]
MFSTNNSPDQNRRGTMFSTESSPNQNWSGTIFSNNVYGDDDDIVRAFAQRFGVSAKDPAIKHTLSCSLEELYQGATKRVKITRQVADRSDLTREIEEILTIDTKPGWKKGTEITFEEKGNERPNITPADVVFIVDEKPHSEFSRDGNDLIVTRRISVAEAFTGYTVHLITLDGRNLTLPINDVIHPNYQKVVPNEGMPIPGDPSKRGILKIKFDIRKPLDWYPLAAVGDKLQCYLTLRYTELEQFSSPFFHPPSINEMTSQRRATAEGVFAEFFGSNSPNQNRRGTGFSSNINGNDNDIFRSFEQSFGVSAPGKDPAIKHTLPCSLEELYQGATKRVKITRQVADRSGLTRKTEEILTIDTKPGWKKGTKITFEEKGNERPNVTPADVVFIVDEKPHSEFTRDGNDLIVTRRISVTEAFTGYTVHLITLDGRNLTLPINDVIHPNYQKVVPNEGMPILGDPTKRGIFKIKFDIRFPARVNAEQKAGIRRLFGP